jgi:hypothetical protein
MDHRNHNPVSVSNKNNILPIVHRRIAGHKTSAFVANKRPILQRFQPLQNHSPLHPVGLNERFRNTTAPAMAVFSAQQVTIISTTCKEISHV